MRFQRLAVQPQQGFTLDLGNPITRGLEFAWAGSDPKRILSTGKAAPSTSTVPTGQDSIGMTGRPDSNTNNTLQTANNPVFMSNTWTGLVFFIQPTIGTDSSLFQSTTGPGTNDRSLGVNSSGALVGYLFDGGAKSATDPVALTAGKPYVACAASDGSSIQVWKSGVLAASTASANGGYTGYGAGGPLCVMGAGFGPSSGTAGSSARIALLAWWSRALSAPEHRALAENPWQVLMLRSGVQSMLMRSAFPAAVGAGVSARPQVFVCT